VGPKGSSQVALDLLSATSSAHQAQEVVCGHQGAGGTAALVAIVVTMGVASQAVGIGGTQWDPKVAPM